MSIVHRGPACRPLLSNHMALLIVISMSSLFFACSPVIKLVYGLKNPAPVSPNQLIQFRNNLFGDSIQTVFFRAQSSYELTEWSVPEAFLFDSLGRPVDFRDPANPKCNGSLEGFLENLRPMQHHTSPMLEHMDLLMQGFSQSPCAEERVQLPPADYHLMITFATWAGKHIFRQTVQSWIAATKANNHVKIHVTLLNVDERCCDDALDTVR